MRRRPWLIVTVFCIALLVVLGLIKFFQIRAAIAFGESFPEPSETVQLTTVEQSQWQKQMLLVGELRASQEIELRNELGGLITEVGYVSNEVVDAGQLLLQLDISQELAQLQAAKAEAELAAADYKRFAGFKNPDAVSQQQVDRAKAQRDIAQAQVANIESVIQRKTIRAPFTGVTSIHQWEVGQFVAADSVIAVIIAQDKNLWVDFAVPQQFSQIDVGTDVRVLSESEASTPATIIAVEQAISRDSRTVQMRAELHEQDIAIKSGAMVRVMLPIGTSRSVVKLTSAAVRVDAFGDYVFVIDTADDDKLRATRRPVTVLAKEGEHSIIGAGLSIGERVATIGAFKLREGVWVKEASEATSE